MKRHDLVMRTERAVLAAALLIGFGAGAAMAQPDDLTRKTAAEAAFRQGKDQIAAGNTAAACESFGKSQELDPQLGTEYNLALCFEKIGKVASAWSLYGQLAETDTNKGRRADAAKRAKAIAPHLMRLLVVVRGDTPNVKLDRDGTDITAAIGVATPVDPGSSHLTATADGFEPWTTDIAVMGEGTTMTVEVPSLTKSPEIVKPPDPIKPDPIIIVKQPPPPPPLVDRGPARRRLGLIIGGVGVGVLGAGAVFGVMAKSANSDAVSECGDINDCRGDAAAAQTLVDKARTRALISTIGFAVGGAAIATGVFLYVMAPKKPTERIATLDWAPTVSPDHVGAVVFGRF
jgi:tetratricopeptide (TPR) repeat protein